jgi:hypothetical protein
MSFGCAQCKTGGQCLGILAACRCQFWEELNFERVSKLDGAVCGFHNLLCGFVYLEMKRIMAIDEFVIVVFT